MQPFPGLKKLLYLDTFGWIAVSAILICVLSGILLAIPYDIVKPYSSITLFVTSNPSASFVRNLHFWSAQVFLVFTLLHIIDHFRQSTELNIRQKGTWFRLSLSLVFLGYVMLSGFILKADADSLQARRILTVLLGSIPIAGRLLQGSFIGPEGNWQLLYIHHAATATIILVIAVYDHVRSIWGNLRSFILVSLGVILLSLFFRAPLGSLNETVMKGPWYFLGLQEILHWVSHPAWVMLFAFLLLLIVYFLPKLSTSYRRMAKYFLFLIFCLYLLLTITSFFFRGENWKWQWPWNEHAAFGTTAHFIQPDFKVTAKYKIPLVQGRAEGCLACHSGMKGLSESHTESITGCFACHLGDPFTLDKKQAHRGMEPVPGNLSNAARTCGNSGCHPKISDRIHSSLMTTLSGLISVDRYAFNESNSPNGSSTTKDIGFSAADRHLRSLCSGCHLGNEKLKPGPAEWLERGGGCNACHTTYPDAAVKDLVFQLAKSSTDETAPAIHPSVDLKVTNDKCRSCHSRSGRIALNYEGWMETTLTSIPVSGTKAYQALPDGRILHYKKADIHHEKGLACIDCHSSRELMGDGKYYLHEEEAVRVQCVDCHPKGKAGNLMTFKQADRESQLIAWLRKIKMPGVTIAGTSVQNFPLLNTFMDSSGELNLILKLSGNSMPVKRQSKACSAGKAHERLSCNTCHTAWSPQCIGCHNSYESQAPGYDLLRNKAVNGSWIEYTGSFLADEPVLGVNQLAAKNGLIQIMIPGMVLTIDKSSFQKGEKSIFHRMYAPSSAHTTQKESRTCRSCHNDPLAIGYGRGTLKLSKEGRWSFEPRFAENPKDGLPEDAWTAFLSEKVMGASTRNGIRPFSLVEQKQILTVGACLICHEPGSRVMLESLNDFKEVLAHRKGKCILPLW